MFRLFDIFKPWPVSYFDKKIKGAQGIMLDDMVAGLLAALTTALLSLGMPDVPDALIAKTKTLFEQLETKAGGYPAQSPVRAD